MSSEYLQKSAFEGRQLADAVLETLQHLGASGFEQHDTILEGIDLIPVSDGHESWLEELVRSDRTGVDEADVCVVFFPHQICDEVADRGFLCSHEREGSVELGLQVADDLAQLLVKLFVAFVDECSELGQRFDRPLHVVLNHFESESIPQIVVVVLLLDHILVIDDLSRHLLSLFCCWCAELDLDKTAVFKV